MGLLGAAAGVIGLGGSLLAGESQRKAASKAAGAQVNAAQSSADLQRDVLMAQLGFAQPQTTAGAYALASLLNEVYGRGAASIFDRRIDIGGGRDVVAPQVSFSGGITPDQGIFAPLESSPLYSLQRFETERALNRQLARLGLAGSGAGIEAFSRSTERLTAGEIARRQGLLSSLAGFGQAGTGGALSALSQAGSGISGAISAAGSAQAQGALASGAARSNMFQILGSFPGQALGAYNIFSAFKQPTAPTFNIQQPVISGGAYGGFPVGGHQFSPLNTGYSI